MRGIVLILMVAFFSSCTERDNPVQPQAVQPPKKSQSVMTSDEEWKKVLTPEQYFVLREKGTEKPFSGIYVRHNEKGVYRCAGCGALLFRSEDKFESSSGWPSFRQSAPNGSVGYRRDNSDGTQRVEVYCKICGGHLGHVFQDGPKHARERYCINSAALKFKAQ